VYGYGSQTEIGIYHAGIAFHGLVVIVASLVVLAHEQIAFAEFFVDFIVNVVHDPLLRIFAEAIWLSACCTAKTVPNKTGNSSDAVFSARRKALPDRTSVRPSVRPGRSGPYPQPATGKVFLFGPMTRSVCPAPKK
jgi:hypothetical protein